MPRNSIIKKNELPDDQVEPVSLDTKTFYQRLPRIPREHISLEDAEALAPPGRFDYLREGVLPREDAILSAVPYTVHPAPLDADFAVGIDADPAGPIEETEEPEDPEETLRDELASEWGEKVEEAAAAAREEGRKEGHEAGYEEGYAAARGELAQEFDEDVERLAADVAQLEQLWHTYIEDAKPALLELAVRVAEAVLDAPLPDSLRGASARAIAEAVEELAGEGTLTVSLHPVDYQRLQEKGLIDQLNANHEHSLRWNPDPERPEGDWHVESPVAMIRHYKSEILNAVHRLLGTSPSKAHGSDASDPTP